jgi:hypothetical protein
MPVLVEIFMREVGAVLLQKLIEMMDGGDWRQNSRHCRLSAC